MVHKGVEYAIVLVEPGIWKWQFRIEDQLKTGKTKCHLQQLAQRRVGAAIDREMKARRDKFQRAAE